MFRYLTSHLPAFGGVALAIYYLCNGNLAGFGTAISTAAVGFGLIKATAPEK